jgi:methionyl-tRNA synthetase
VALSAELNWLATRLEAMDKSVRQFQFREAMQTLMEISMAGNLLLQANEPWARMKTDPGATRFTLFVAVQYVAVLQKAMAPFLPFAAEKLAGMLGLAAPADPQGLQHTMELLAQGQPVMEAGHGLGEAVHLFSRLAEEPIDAQIARLHASAVPTAPATPDRPDDAPRKGPVNYDQFSAMDLRTGVILAAEKVPKADRLLRLEVDLGYERRTVVSGIAEYYSPEEVVGRQVVVLANLEPRMLRGIESRGMILMATGVDGRLHFVAPADPMAAGMEVR